MSTERYRLGAPSCNRAMSHQGLPRQITLRQLLHMATSTTLGQDHWTSLDDQSYQQRRSNGLGDTAMAFDEHLQMLFVFCFFRNMLYNLIWFVVTGTCGCYFSIYWE